MSRRLGGNDLRMLSSAPSIVSQIVMTSSCNAPSVSFAATGMNTACAALIADTLERLRARTSGALNSAVISVLRTRAIFRGRARKATSRARSEAVHAFMNSACAAANSALATGAGRAATAANAAAPASTSAD